MDLAEEQGCGIRSDGSIACWGDDLGEPPDVPAASLAIGDNIAGLISTNGVLHTWREMRLWPIWGVWDVAEERLGFGAFRILGRAPESIELGRPVDIAFGTTAIAPTPEFRVASGELPPGLDLSRDGRITGTPEIDGSYGPVTIVVDNDKAPLASTTFEMTVVQAD